MEVFTLLKDFYCRLQKYFKNPAIISNYFIFASTMPPSLGDNIILENGTIKTDKVAMRDLAFWLPLAASYEASPMRWCKICTFV